MPKEVASERICEAPKRDRDIEQNGAEEKTLGTIVGLKACAVSMSCLFAEKAHFETA